MMQQVFEKLPSLAVGTGGVSLILFTVAGYAQAIGIILGAIIVCIQFYRIMRGIFKKKDAQ